MSTTFYVNISQLFNVNPDISSECIGTSSKNNACHRPISANIRIGASTTLHSLQRLESNAEFWNQLYSISCKLLCHQHYDQREIICEQWWQALLDLSSMNSLPEFRVPGGFPEEDHNVMAAILELSRPKDDKSFQWREEEAKRAKAERAEAKRAKEQRAEAKRAKAKAQRAEAKRADAKRAEERRAGNFSQGGYQQWVKDSEKARKSLTDVPFPDPPSYGCCNTACKAFRSETRIEWCKHDIDRLLGDGKIRWDKAELRRLLIKWHPDKFTRRPHWQFKATTLFQIISTLYR
jgi:FtsZ-interacting cell division protein YlmF